MPRKNDTSNSASIAFITSSGLRGRQSVRATFKLSAACIEAISIVAAQLGIKQKSLFDHLAQDSESLNAIAREVQNAHVKAGNRVQKTYVISRQSLSLLDDISRAFNAPRDALVEFSVRRLLPVIDREQKKYEMRKAAYAGMRKHLSKGRQLLDEMIAQLGKEDPVVAKMASVMDTYTGAAKAVETFLERTQGIEDFDPEDFGRLEVHYDR
ncbi:hypothetical protein DSCO28_21550 [Desulfosarcina ovata subsp. sediminis]|uniref:Uncharacterized protein n=1 Tax=Desulfosarcina ovata subsp. sediminis TaxID=885957 RepID=A0A5K7ZP87_9BACT|nr:hypothetical protein [Desulfosarcina ovata]BBO81589.1 hypothetical protein DSCO28_21550 [Desulfosarcina ovata subsp. sediminis]